MSSSRPPLRRRSALAAGLALAVAGWYAAGPANGQDPDSRQLVMFGVVATPGSAAMDPKISPVVRAQLRRALPGHGFKLIKVRSQRVMAGQSISCEMVEGFEASATLMSPLDPNGKVQIQYGLSLDEMPQFQTIMVTPPDQFNYFDKPLPGNKRLLIGVGAR